MLMVLQQPWTPWGHPTRVLRDYTWCSLDMMEIKAPAGTQLCLDTRYTSVRLQGHPSMCIPLDLVACYWHTWWNPSTLKRPQHTEVVIHCGNLFEFSQCGCPPPPPPPPPPPVFTVWLLLHKSKWNTTALWANPRNTLTFTNQNMSYPLSWCCLPKTVGLKRT